MSAPDFPTGAALDRLILWTVAQMATVAPDVEAWSSVVVFYALREYGLTWASEETYYCQLVARSLDRLRDAGFLTMDADGLGWRLRQIEAL